MIKWIVALILLGASAASAEADPPRTKSAKVTWLGLMTQPWEPSDDEPADAIEYTKAQQSLKFARWSFLLGTGGMAIELVASGLSLAILRTVGNILWGVGWTGWLGAYGETEQILRPAGSNILPLSNKTPFRRASTQGAIGESSNLFLIPEGFYIHPLYNDVNGGTDKLLTASTKMGLLRTFDNVSVESIAYWRFLTPTFKTEFEADDLPKPVGRYADWAEWKTSMSYLSPSATWPLRFQLSLGYSDIGNKGGREMHREVHRITRNTLENLEYTNQPTGRFWTGGLEVGLASRGLAGGNTIHHLTAATGETSKMMKEVGLRWNGVLILEPEWWEYGVEAKVLRQLSSEVYDSIRPWRYEGSIGVRLFRHLTPTVKYVSSYLKDDPIGQTYFDLLHYNFIF